jgi:predicted Zn-dependent peptidase
MYTDPQLIRLDFANGLRLVHQPVHTTRLALVAVIVNTGSRDEAPAQQGMAHFIEHLVFKGTQRRKAFHILNRIDAVGGDLNAYTDKEKTVYYATVTAQHFERALDLLLDIAFRPTFDPHELEKEKQVIAEEMDMYADTPEESILEEFEAALYGSHPLGHPILGTKETLESFNRSDVLHFAEMQYAPQQVVVSVVGNITEREVKRLANKHLASISARSNASPGPRLAPQTLPASNRETRRPIQQAHVVLGGASLPLRHELLPAFMVLNNHLGGSAMNTLLNLHIRERYGLAYSLGSFANHFTDSGAWGIHFACEQKSVSRLEGYVKRELDSLCRQPFTATRTHSIKQQFLGMLQISNESLYANMIAQGKDLVDFGNTIPLTETIRKVEAVTAAQLHEVAHTLMQPDKLTRVAYVPTSTSE